MNHPSAVGVMGGTFDPIHFGHLVAASEVAHRFGLERVIFVPTGQPWQKTDRVTASAEHRYLMSVIATSTDERFMVSRVDVDRPGPTYSIDTLGDLRQQHPTVRDWYFITGADALSKIMTWRDHDEVLSLAHMIGVSRPGHGLARPELDTEAISLLEVPALAISSTDIRERVRTSAPVDYLVPDGVARYIAKTGLYRDAP